MSMSPRPDTVLVVDDQEGIRLLIRRILELQGFHVIDAEDGETALRLFSNDPKDPEPVLAMIDITMPGMDGVTLARRLRSLRPALPLILMSGFDMDDLFDPGTTFDPAAGYLEKPFDVQRLTAVIAQTLKDAK